MTDGDYALALSLFFVSYNVRPLSFSLDSKLIQGTVVRSTVSLPLHFQALAHECLRANLMMKKLRPRVWLSLIVTLFGICVSRTLLLFLM